MGKLCFSYGVQALDNQVTILLIGILAKHVSFAGFGIVEMIGSILICTSAPSVVGAIYFK